jgi:dephospho-CoA kinase
MKKIGLTGGIGSGKSTVAEIFRHLGIPVFNSDEIARKLQEEDESLKGEIAGIFGNEIYQNGKLDRAKVASIVFSDPEKLKQLNAVVHPAVGKAREQFFLENAKLKYVIQEAAILFEIGLEKSLDGMIVVTAPDEIRIQRVMERDKISREDVLLRIKNQLSQEEKVKKADFVIQNDGKSMLVPQIVEIDKQLKK